MLEVGILKNFNSGTYKAGVQLAGSVTTYFDNISVAKNIPADAMVVGNYVIVAIPGGNPRDACVIAAWPQGTAGGGGAGTFLELSDTPSSYSAQGRRLVTVKSDHSGLEFGPPLEEQAWRNCIALPYADQYDWQKDAGNPIFTKSGVSGKFDENRVQGVSVRYVDDYFYLFYGGGGALDNNQGIGVARSTTYNSGFSRLNNGDPIIERVADTWRDKVTMPSVVYDPYDVASKRWKCWFPTMDSGSGRYIGYAYSEYPDSGWSTPVSISLPYTPQGWSVYAVRMGRLYVLYYPATNNEIYGIISKDPDSNFHGVGKAISKGASGQWDDLYLGYLSGFFNQGILYLIYGGCTGSAANYRLGMSGAGFRELWATGQVFTKFTRNPILNVGASGAWDDKLVFCPSLLPMETSFYMYYTGQNSDTAERAIGVATIP